MFLILLAAIVILLIYQLFFYWVFKDPVSITGSVNARYLPENGTEKVKEIKFKINNRINKAFDIEKIILKIDEQHHILDNYKIISYPFTVKGFETFTLKLPIELLQQLVEKDIKDLREMFVRVSITIRGNNASYRSNQIKFS